MPTNITNKDHSRETKEEYFDDVTWPLTWTLAFPTLLPSRLYISPRNFSYLSDEDYRDDSNLNCSTNSQDEYHTSCPQTITNENSVRNLTPKCHLGHDDNSYIIPVTWSLLAYREIFGDLSGTKTVEGIVSHPEYIDLHSFSSSSTQENNLGYGEITPKTVMELIVDIQSKYFHSNEDELDATQTKQSRGTIIDLGSGTGRVLFAAALAHSFGYAVGIEVVKELHHEALRNWNKWMDWYPNSSWNQKLKQCEDHKYDDKIEDIPPCAKTDLQTGENEDFSEEDLFIRNQKLNSLSNTTQFNFLHQDLNSYSTLLTPSQYTAVTDWTDMASIIASLSPGKLNIILIHATLFDLKLMSCIQRICCDCPKGTFFISVSKCLLSQHSEKVEFELLEESEREMTWGMGTIYIQRRL